MQKTVAALVTLLLIGASAGSSAAQTRVDSFAQLPRVLKVGDSVFVTDRQDREMRGELKRLSRTSLVMVVNGVEREVPSAEIRRIDKDGDPMWDGALIGFGVGVSTLGLIGSGFVCGPKGGAGCRVGAALGIGAEWAPLGLLIDWLHKGRTRVYRSVASPTVSISPLISSRRRGVAVSLSF